MNKNLFLRLLLVIAIFVVALYYSLSKPIKLGLDLKVELMLYLKL